MGTQLQPKSYFPVFHPIRDLNEEMNCNWSLIYEDKAFTGRIYDDAKLMVVNDKDMLRRTMLEHEAVFRKQVNELHRLYQVQKELMDEVKKKRLYKFSFPFGASHSSHSDNRPLNFLKQECSGQIENGGSQKDSMISNSMSKKIPRKVFDLHLPADAYIENEDAEETEKKILSESSFRSLDPLNMIYDVEPENNIKLTLGNSGGCPIPTQDSRKPSIHPQKDLSIHNLADLNKPIEDLCGKDHDFSHSYSYGMKMYNKETEGQPILKSSTKFVRKDFFIPMRGEVLSSSKFSEVDKEEGQKLPCLDAAGGQSRLHVNPLSPGFSCGKFSMSCESLQIQLNRALEDRDKAIHSVEASRTNLHLVNSGHSRVPAPQITHSFSVASQSAFSRTVSPPVSSLTNLQNKISHIPIAVQTLPCSNESTESKHTIANISYAGNSSEKLQLDGDVRSAKSGNKSSYKNGHEHGSLFDSNSSVHFRFPLFTLGKPDINSRGDSSVHENSECHEQQKHLKSSHCTNIKFPDELNLNQVIQTGHLNGLDTQSNASIKHPDSSKGMLSFRTNPAESAGTEEMCFSGNSHLVSSCGKVLSGIVRAEEKRKGHSLHDLLHARSSLEVKEEKLQKNGTFDRLNNGVMGLPFLNKFSQSVNCLPSSYQEQSVSGYVFARSSGRGTGAKSDHLHFQNDISIISGNEKDLLPPSVPSVAQKSACQIDLEAPADALEEDSIYFEGEIVGMKYDKKTVKMYSTKKDGSRENELSHDTALQAAAETIVSLSSHSFSSLHEINTQYVTTTSSSSLLWFAEVVTLNAEYGGVQNVTDGNGIKPSDDDGLDLFESVTLKLEEMKVDEYMCKPSWQEVNQKDEDIGSAALLLTKPRRVQARKRKQRRDFQKDILPGLASLSRHEVTEDLQILVGLTRSLGMSGQTIPARRAAGRNGFNCKPRGRRRPKSLAIGVAEIHVNPMPTLPSPADAETRGRNIMVWGRTTRRCRRQRLPPDHISAPQC